MQDNFDLALKTVLLFEGGYSDHPSDPGGATNLGITQAVLSAWRKERGIGTPVTKESVRRLTLDEASDIYHNHYWQACQCDKLPSGIDLAVFDCAVNQGVGRAVKLLQASVQVTSDGVLGPKTLAAIEKTDEDALLMEFMARRMFAYGTLKIFDVFGLGWSRRALAVFSVAGGMLKNERIVGA